MAVGYVVLLPNCFFFPFQADSYTFRMEDRTLLFSGEFRQQDV